jgi:OHCU decarboxylase
MTLVEFNRVPRYRAEAELIEVCASRAWVRAIAGRRPFHDLGRLQRAATEIWWSLDETDWREAFDAHPKIGERKVDGWAAREQSGMNHAGTAVTAELEQSNRDYLSKFGYIFIVCATGKTADQMLAVLQSRLSNPAEREIRIAAEEQSKITQLRLEKLITP